MIIISTTLIVLALTWGGVRYSWGSVMVAVPLALGLALLVGFIFYEIYVPDHPVVSKVHQKCSPLTAKNSFLSKFWQIGRASRATLKRSSACSFRLQQFVRINLRSPLWNGT